MPENLKVLYHDEVQLLDYGESRTRGKYVLFRLSENGEDPLAVFRGLDVGTKVQPGHIFNLTVTQGDILPAPEEEEKEPELKGGKLAKEAAIMVKHPNFHRWLMAVEVIMPDHNADDFRHVADWYLKNSCSIQSKRELDHNNVAAGLYRAMCMDYSEWSRKQ